MAGKLASMLRQNDSESIQKSEVACVEIAGLCHDLGHGPFSHAFEEIVPKDENGKEWNHEEQSVIMLKYLIKNNSLEEKLEGHHIYDKDIEFICQLISGHEEQSVIMLKYLIKNNSLEEKLEGHHIYDKDIEFICQLISGVKKDQKMLRENKLYLYQIVNNSVNGVDVDKWDYLARDTLYLGMKSAFDFNRILPSVKVLDVKRGNKTRGELCFRDKVYSHEWVSLKQASKLSS
eukprot:XP_011664055.1 PREDICTED: deoxynucleoside triphosphate triphosphohydrolase SAMHD1-like [Strongylocentrotus purpuratus]